MRIQATVCVNFIFNAPAEMKHWSSWNVEGM